MSKQQHVHDDYTIGWICPLEVEQIAAIQMLDQQHGQLTQPITDPNSYILGDVGGHNVVMADLPITGNCSTATLVAHMRRTFPCLKFMLLVGIGGGVPIRTKAGPIRLGHVVVSKPIAEHSGAIQYDRGKAEVGEFRRTGSLAPPPNVLLSAAQRLATTHATAETDRLQLHLKRIDTSKRGLRRYKYPGLEKDHLYQPDYIHANRDLSCRECGCDASKRIARGQKGCEDQENSGDSSEGGDQDAQWVIIHRGTIASGEKVMRNGIERDKLGKEYGVLCFEMEAAGALNDFPCLVIRGISDYADSHKSDIWQGYAAATAAAYARELFHYMPIEVVAQCEVVKDDITSLNPDARSAPYNTSLNDFSSITNHYYHHSYQSQLTQQSEDKALKETLIQADAAICEYYKSTERLKIERLSGETLSLEECYINLALIDLSKGQHEDKQSFSLKARLRLEAIDTTQQIALDGLFAPRKLSDGVNIDPRRIFIRGRAGIGKTTLCKKIVYEFLHNRIGSGLFNRLLWLPLRGLGNKNKNAKYGWLDVLQHAFSPSPQVPNWDHLAAVMSRQLLYPDFQLKTLFLLDGLDEVSRDWGEDIVKFLESIVCDAPNIIITSRPQANILKTGRFDIELETIGFTPDQVTTYIDHSVENEQTRSSMKDLIAVKPLLQGLLRIPVQLDAFCCTWSSETREDGSKLTGTDNLSTMTALYSSISIELSRKDLVRIRRHDQPQTLEEIDVKQLVADEHRFLEVFAFQGLVNDIIEFSPQHQKLIDSHFRQSEITLPLSYGSTLQQLSFLRTSNVQQHRGRRNYHFLHLTFQEFFAAGHFVRHWLSNKNLTRLDLGSVMSEHEETMPPTKFLQTEKYNPRFNIFWRFVTGLVQERQNRTSKNEPTDKYRNILAFFDELNHEPSDLLGPIHRRLLMYCLSEVVPEKRQDIQDMRQAIEEGLRQGIITENNSYNRLALGTEAEFPEHILLSLLQDDDHLSHGAVLSALGSRSFIHTKTLRAVLRYTTNEFTMDLRLQAINAVLKNSRIDSQEIVAQTTPTLCSMLKDKDLDVQRKAVKALVGQSRLPEEVISALIALLRDKAEDKSIRDAVRYILECQQYLSIEDINVLIALLKDNVADGFIQDSVEYVLRYQRHLSTDVINVLIALFRDKAADKSIRKSIGRALNQHQYLSTEAIDTLVALLKDKNEDSNVRHIAADILQEQSKSQPEKVVNILLSVLEDKNEELSARGYAAWALQKQSHLSKEAVNALFTLLKDGNKDTQRSAARTLRNQLYLSEETVNTLLVLLKDENPTVRWLTAGTLGEQSNPSEETMNALFALLKDENSTVRFNVIMALKRHSPHLPDEVINVLSVMLKDEDFYVRQNVANVLGEQSRLSEEVINALVALLKDKNSDVRQSTADALGEQSRLSEEAIDALLARLKDKKPLVRRHTAKALAKQLPPPSDKVTNALFALLKDENFYVRRDVVDILAGQSPHLPDEVIDALFVMLKDENSGMRRSAADILRKWSHLPEKVIDGLLALLKTQNFEAYRALQHHKGFYSMIRDLDTKTWQGLWSIWLDQSVYDDISCYEFEGSLFLWENGVLHTITDQPAQTQRLLEAVPNRPSKRKTEVVTPSDVNGQSKPVTETQGNAQAKPPSKSRWPRTLWSKKRH